MHVRKLWDDLQSNLWFRPALWLLFFAALAIGLTTLDRRLSQLEAAFVEPWFLTSGADGARTMLGSISSAMLTVTSLIFSILMIAVVQMANAYSPSVLRQYLSDQVHQNVLGILVGTFLFSLIVLRSVRSTDDREFVPLISMNAALLLALVSTGAFVYFINHVAQSIKVDNIIRVIVSRARTLIADMFPSSLGRPFEGEIPSLPDDARVVVAARSSGYLQLIEADNLMEVATRAGVTVRLDHAVGDYVVPGMALFSVWPYNSADEALTRALLETVVLGLERTLVQDLLFSAQQLSDVALRALSPGINDPTTARTCIDALAALVVELLQRDPVYPYRCDEQGALRVIAQGVTFDQMLDEAFSQIARYGAGDLSVVLRLLEVCCEIGKLIREPGENLALWQLVQRIVYAAGQQIGVPIDRRQVNDRLARAAETLQRERAVERLFLPVHEVSIRQQGGDA